MKCPHCTVHFHDNWVVQQFNRYKDYVLSLDVSGNTNFALVSDPKLGLYEPEQLKNAAIGVSLFNGSDFTMLKMMEGFLKREETKWTNCRTS